MRAPAPFYARSSLNVECYDERTAADIARSTVRGDAAWYRRLARRTGGPVLEGACGTGRVSWEIARAGIEIVGFDRSPHMLRAAEAKRSSMPPRARDRATFVRGDLRTFDLGRRRFPLAIVPFRSFQCLLTPEDQRASLLRFHRHLRPGGLLVLNLFGPKMEYLVPRARVDIVRIPVKHPFRGTDVVVEIGERVLDPFHQVFSEVWTFRESDAKGRTIRVDRETLTMRWTWREEMRYLAEACGFAVEAEHSDFRGGKPAYAKEQVWVLRSIPNPTQNRRGRRP